MPRRVVIKTVFFRRTTNALSFHPSRSVSSHGVSLCLATSVDLDAAASNSRTRSLIFRTSIHPFFGDAVSSSLPDFVGLPLPAVASSPVARLQTSHAQPDRSRYTRTGHESLEWDGGADDALAPDFAMVVLFEGGEGRGSGVGRRFLCGLRRFLAVPASLIRFSFSLILFSRRLSDQLPQFNHQQWHPNVTVHWPSRKLSLRRLGRYFGLDETKTIFKVNFTSIKNPRHTYYKKEGRTTIAVRQLSFVGKEKQ